jgi:phospholipase C
MSQNFDRREVFKLIGAAGLSGALPPSITKALAVSANRRTGTIADVEHIVILTQENRSFDHLFGALRGVRGFADPRAVTLPTGKSVWHQPTPTGELLPFRPPVASVGQTFLPDPPHGWTDSHAAWNGGKFDQWVPSKGAVSMTYHTRKDIPYHYALADAFTVCDAYHCSVMGPTDPNRYHMWTGWLGNDGKQGGPVINNAEAGYDWSTFPERLVKAGISWKVYQDVGVGLNADGYWGWTGDPYIGNYGDNSLLYFHQYQNALNGSVLAQSAKTGTNINAQNRDPARLFDVFREDVRTGKLPAVSWIAPPEAYSEHPNHPANFGAWYTSQIMDILASNPEVFSKTVLLINYDEEGGFFDHSVPPTPPFAGQGASTVSTVNEIYPAGDPSHPSGPYGLGIRVPMIVVSPWSKGGWVNSQVFDHTSLIRFIEARYAKDYPGLVESNITPWRRAVAGDLTSTLDFRKGESGRVRLPSTAAFMPPDLVRHDDYTIVTPTSQQMPVQEPGVRPARALPYELHTDGLADVSTGSFALSFGNSGKAAAVFHVRSGNTADAPQSFTVEPQKRLPGVWRAFGNNLGYDLSVHGPNGFFRAFKGSASRSASNLLVRASYGAENDRISLTITNTGTQEVQVRVADAYRGMSHDEKLKPGQSKSKGWSLENSYGWYDLLVTVEGDTGYQARYAGHVETGEHSVSDPAMGRVRLES